MSEITTATNAPLAISGIVYNVLPLQTGMSKSGNAWQKQDFILETLEKYPRMVCISLFGDRVEKFPVQVGRLVTVSIDIESREFNGRWYTDVRAWNVVYNDHLGVQAPAPAPAPAPVPTATTPTAQTAAPAPPQANRVANGAPAQATAQAVADELPF